MKSVLKYRLPVYLTGFLIGAFVAFTAYQAKRVFAPNFHVMNYEGAPFQIKKGGDLILTYDVEEPGRHLAYGYPSEVFVAKKVKEEAYEPIVTIPYRDIVEKVVKIGPLEQEGEYVFRGIFYLCEKPGDKDCLKLIWDNVGTVNSNLKSESNEISISINNWLSKLKNEIGDKFNN